MNVNEGIAGETGATEAPAAAAEGTEAQARQIGELEFLVGTSCSRAINLLMRSDRDAAELADELAFLGERATRLAALLRGPAVGDAAAADAPARADTDSSSSD
jgi:hypothetical protein